MKKQLGCEKISKISAEKVKIKPIFKDTKYKFVPSPEGPVGLPVGIHTPGITGPIAGTCGVGDDYFEIREIGCPTPIARLPRR